MEQQIPGGPVASQEAIKELGTNGGGYYNANSSHPFENTNGFTNFLQIYMLLLIPLSLVVTFGTLVKDKRQSRLLLAVMAGILVLFAGLASLAEHLEPERKMLVAREITKMYEENVQGTIAEVVAYFLEHPDHIRGEFVVVVSPV